MDLDMGSGAFCLRSIPPAAVNSRLEEALKVYKDVWSAFYTWEETWCEGIIRECAKLAGQPSIRTRNHDDNVPLEFHFKPSKGAAFCENFTVEHFNASEESERYSTMYCSNTNEEAKKPYSYPHYESCTPGLRNEVKVDTHCGALAFIPYADDEAFKIDQYLLYIDLFAWQSDFPDPDWELIELEVMTRLVADCSWGLSLREVDQLRILRKSRISLNSGLLWDISQRDVLNWTLPGTPKLSEDFVQHGSDVVRHIDNNFPHFCPKLYCLRFFCGAHGTLFHHWDGIDHPKPKKTSEDLRKESSGNRRCGESCFRLVYSEDAPLEMVAWENEEDITLVESILKILPDTSPCDLAIICRKRCSEERP
ncbi:hypothetical protein H2248_004961 [Termitomyces sp. 'cryptogamus']|nr:hypothetical protein H2248_004961 [Termitomyces sp. 'cryptogamus']